jgi:hypothetical protein
VGGRVELNPSSYLVVRTPPRGTTMLVVRAAELIPQPSRSQRERLSGV